MLSGGRRLGRGVFFLTFNVGFFGAFSTHIIALFHYSQRHNHYSHFALIPLVSIYLLYLHRTKIFLRVDYSPVLGFSLLGTGLLAFTLSSSQQANLNQNDFFSWTALGMVLVWIGGFVTCFGPAASRAALFPLAFLVFAIPIPSAVLNRVITALQLASAEVTGAVFQLLPIPVFREGTVFALPGLTIDVAPECSGIRSGLALFITAVLAGHFFLRSPGAKVVLALAAVPIAIFKNGLRIVTLCLLTVYVDDGFLSGPLHTRGGYPFFILALIFMVPVLWLLRRSERDTRV